MTDRELLELAARAAGYEFVWDFDENLEGPCIIDKDRFPLIWNPLDEDGDALRLAVKMEMCLDLSQEGGFTFDHLPLKAKAVCHDKSDPYAVTRRAIVCAAAAIGKTLG